MLKKIALLIVTMLYLPAHADVLQWLTKTTESMPFIFNNGNLAFSYSRLNISTNGRYISFLSAATNLVENDNNGLEDVFMHDVITGNTQRVNTTSSGQELSYQTDHYSAPTADGKYVAFVSSDPLLTSQGINEVSWVFLKNTQTGEVTNISQDINNVYFDVYWKMYLSDDAQQLTFVTATNIDPLHSLYSQVYRKNLVTNNVVLLSINSSGSAAANSDVLLLDVSGNGRYVLARSEATDLTSDVINNSLENLFLFDTVTLTTTLVNTTPTGQPSADSAFYGFAGVSDFGDVAFVSTQDDLVINDTNGDRDAFFYHHSNNTLQRINLTVNGQQLTDAFSYFADINDAGTRVVFTEKNDVVTNNDNNGFIDVFMFDVNTGTNSLVSNNPQNLSANNASNWPRISGDGSRVVFTSAASDLSPDPVIFDQEEVFVHNLNTGTLKKVTQPAFAPQTITSQIKNPFMSQDQMTVIYSTQSAGFDANGGDDELVDLYLLDRTTNQHQLLFSKATGTDLSPSGQFLVFTSSYSQPDGLTALSPTIFLYNRNNQQLRLIDVGTDARVNDEGDVVFETAKQIDSQDFNSENDLYGFDRSSGSITLISEGLDGLATGDLEYGFDMAGSGNNATVVFASYNSNLVPNDTFNTDIYLRPWPTGFITKISQTQVGITGDGDSRYPRLSDNGRFVVYNTDAKNLTTDDYTGADSNQIMYYDRQLQTNQLASINDSGLPNQGNNPDSRAGISSSGRYVSYTYWDGINDQDFAGDDDYKNDVVLFDTFTQSARIISESNLNPNLPKRSVSNSVLQITESSSNPALVGVLFTARNAVDLTGIPNHPGHSEVFLYQQGGPDLTLSLHIQGSGQLTGSAGISCLGSCDYEFPLGSEIDVIATPESGFQFAGWNTTFTECDDNLNLCTTVINRDQSITAYFIDPNDVIFADGFE